MSQLLPGETGVGVVVLGRREPERAQDLDRAEIDPGPEKEGGGRDPELGIQEEEEKGGGEFLDSTPGSQKEKIRHRGLGRFPGHSPNLHRHHPGTAGAPIGGV